MWRELSDDTSRAAAYKRAMKIAITSSLLISTLVAHAAADPKRIDPGPWAGTLHKKYASKVVFSSRPIAMDAADDRAAYLRYSLGDPLYIRYWSSDSPRNLLPDCSTPRIIASAAVNGGKPDAFAFYDVDTEKLTERKMASLTNTLELAFTTATTYDPNETPEAGREAIRLFTANVIPKLRAGDNQLRVVVELDCGSATNKDPVLAEGTITITVKQGAVAAYLTKFGTRVAKSPFRGSRTLVSELAAALKKKSDWRNEQFIGAQIADADWTPIRHDISGRVIAKQIDALVVVRADDARGSEECRMFRMSFRRDAAGGALYQYGTGDATPIACSNAPK